MLRLLLPPLLLLLRLAALLVLLGGAGARAQGVEVSTLGLNRQDGQLTLEFSLRVQLSRPVEDALRRGVPMYFVAQASTYRNRWYWRDERVARVSRSWRLVYQPLTSSWRVGIGALTQNFATLDEADIAAYVASGEPMGRAGAYAIQGRDAVFVERLDGSYSGVMGLPLFETAALLTRIGFPVL